MKRIGNKILELQNRSACHKASTNLLRNNQIRKTFVDLHQNQTVVPIDKASGNVAIRFTD